MSDYKALSLSECAERLLSAEDPAVCIHVRPDGDAVGSATALCEVFYLLGKSCPLVITEQIPKRLEFLTEGIEKTTEIEGRTLISIDVASPSQLGALYEKGIPVLSIDHHRVNTPYCDNCTVPDASSAGEVLYSIVKELISMGKLSLTCRLAERIYAAISSDTGGFLFSNAKEETYKAAAELIGAGIDHAEINRKLFNSKEPNQIRAEGYVALNLKTYENGRICYSVLSKKERDGLGLDFPDFETAIDVVRALRGSEIAFALKETDDGKFKASLRSNGKDVASVAKRHSGGGHTRAAGCTVDAKTIEKAEEILLSELSALLKE
jgi:phosphoesterase RecJ-like protein